VLISPSQFVVFSCRGSDDRMMLSSFNFLPLETWEEPLSGPVGVAHFMYAPKAGRFAMSRLVTTTSVPMPGSTLGPLGTLGPAGLVAGQTDSTTSQEVRVYQTESGDLLVKLNCSPVSRTGQNFDLSADGLSALVVRDSVIEVYRLPPLSAQDKKDLAEVQAREPPQPHSNLVRLRHIAEEEAQSVAESPGSGDSQDAKPAAAPAATAPATAPATAAAAAAEGPPANAPANAGDVETHRKPPTLLNPGETVENGKKPPE
jgi:hypothetical protein